MSGNLIIVMGETIVFSTILQKPNGLPVFASWRDLIDPRIGRLTIPIGFENMFITSAIEFENKIKSKKILQGPICIDVVNESICESYSTDTIIINNTIPYGKDSFYCRANTISLESAATAAYFLYKDPVKIYKEALKACNITRHQFFKGNILSINKYLTELSVVAKFFEKEIKTTNTESDDSKTFDKNWDKWKSLIEDQHLKMDLETFF